MIIACDQGYIYPHINSGIAFGSDFHNFILHMSLVFVWREAFWLPGSYASGQLKKSKNKVNYFKNSEFSFLTNIFMFSTFLSNFVMK